MRIIIKYAHLCSMKTRLNLIIDNALLKNMKTYALKRGTSISELVEHYFKTVARPAKRKNIIDMVNKLETPAKVNMRADLKDLYYKDKT
ncbi:hypothetical protein BC659_0938 [Sediminibacterium goheungense]|uniref:Uncharacterized protein n=2 Tax=Sediminibacterium goheungense TaxID=1086393 RepID=A0A4R6J1W3_9BACT|nr:hypothetical protein BC659_0938 [Sediminibacterium goheungense]